MYYRTKGLRQARCCGHQIASVSVQHKNVFNPLKKRQPLLRAKTLSPCRIGGTDLTHFQGKQVMYVDFYAKTYLLSMSAMNSVKKSRSNNKNKRNPVLAMTVQKCEIVLKPKVPEGCSLPLLAIAESGLPSALPLLLYVRYNLAFLILIFQNHHENLQGNERGLIFDRMNSGLPKRACLSARTAANATFNVRHSRCLLMSLF